MISFSDISDRNAPLVIAHRGASTAARENTIEAFNKAIEMGADAVEFDVRRTADNVLVIHHDESVTGSHIAIARSTYDQLLRDSEAQQFRIPTLEEALKTCCGRIAVDIELKEQGYEREVHNVVRKYYDTSHAAFKSFRDGSVARLRQLEPTAAVGLLVGASPPASIIRRLHDIFPSGRLRRCGASFVCPHWRLLKFGFLQRMRRLKMPVLVWTVDDEALARGLIEKGAAGIITNRPEMIRRLIANSEQGTEYHG